MGMSKYRKIVAGFDRGVVAETLHNRLIENCKGFFGFPNTVRLAEGSEF